MYYVGAPSSCASCSKGWEKGKLSNGTTTRTNRNPTVEERSGVADAKTIRLVVVLQGDSKTRGQRHTTFRTTFLVGMTALGQKCGDSKTATHMHTHTRTSCRPLRFGDFVLQPFLAGFNILIRGHR